VDPVFGTDFALSGNPPASPSPQINNQAMPFRTLQAVIDQVFIAQELLFQPNTPPTVGVVYALPGIYGPNGSGDLFPITMRDRVNVQGLGAQACVLREVAQGSPPPQVTSPTDPSVFLPSTGISPAPQPLLPTINAVVVLVDFGSASPEGPSLLGPSSPPWDQQADSFETFDGFTLEGGDIQMRFWVQPSAGFKPKPTHARVTNCVLDMRHQWSPADGVTIDGPFVGIQMAKRHTPLNGIRGYPEQFVLIAHNTFLMGSRNFDAVPPADAWIRCRQGAVGVMDTIDPGCLLQLSVSDVESASRGVGTPGVYNNIFRTAPPVASNVQPMALLGIDASDTLLFDAATGTVRETNAFDPQLNLGSGAPPFGVDNGWFRSEPMIPVFVGSTDGLDLFNSGTPVAGTGFCAGTLPAGSVPAPLPTPIVPIFDGVVGVDPCFVGEFLNDQGLVPPGPGGVRCHDWRLLPGSPMVNQGVAPMPSTATTGPIFCPTTPSLSCFPDHLCSQLRSSDWDFEEYGNLRTVDGVPDLGADETHGYVCAGSYGNDSKSHNVPATGLSPSAPLGQATRFLILRSSASQQSIVLHGKAQLPPVPTPANGPTAWTQPPGTLTPALRGPATLPTDSRAQWITFADPTAPPDPTPTPWHNGLANPQPSNYVPAWVSGIQPQLSFVWLSQPDDESTTAPPVAPPGFGTYFATQLVMYTLAGVQVYWSNLQAEYR